MGLTDTDVVSRESGAKVSNTVYIPSVGILGRLYNEIGSERIFDPDDARFSTLKSAMSAPVPIMESSWGDQYRIVDASVCTGYCGTFLGLYYRVITPEILSRCRNDMDMVCHDSCVECFISVEMDDGKTAGKTVKREYINFEFNPFGACYASRGTGRYDREFLNPFQLEGIVRCGNVRKLAPETLGIDDVGPVWKEGMNCWDMLIILPLDMTGVLLSSRDVDMPGRNIPADYMKGLTLKGNFFTTGDDLSSPVYQSWNRIHSTKPDFHRPEFFGTIVFN